MLGISHHSARRITTAAVFVAAVFAALILVAMPSRAADPVQNIQRQATAAAKPKISDKKARKILLSKVINPKSLVAGDNLIAFRMKRPLAAKTKIGAYGDYESAVKLREPAWFFWIDDDPKALFGHPTRYVLIDAASGKVKVLARDWWPVIKGEAPSFNYAAPTGRRRIGLTARCQCRPRRRRG